MKLIHRMLEIAQNLGVDNFFTIYFTNSGVLLLNASCYKTIGTMCLSKATNFSAITCEELCISLHFLITLLLPAVVTRGFEIKIHTKKRLQVRMSGNAMCVSIFFSCSVCIVVYVVIANLWHSSERLVL